MGFLAALVGGSTVSFGRGLFLLAVIPMLAGAWMLVRRMRIEPVAAEVPVERAALRVFVRRTLAQRALGPLAQRADRAFARAERAAELLEMPELLPRPAAIRARLDSFDERAHALGLAVASGQGEDAALYELEVVATSIERALPEV